MKKVRRRTHRMARFPRLRALREALGLEVIDVVSNNTCFITLYLGYIILNKLMNLSFPD